MKKYDRIEVVENHVLANTRLILFLFVTILVLGIIVGIGFYNIKYQIPNGEWECVEERNWTDQDCKIYMDEIFNKYNFKRYNKDIEAYHYDSKTNICYVNEFDYFGGNSIVTLSLNNICTKYQYVKYGEK